MSIFEQVQGRSLEGTSRSTALGVCLNLSFEKTEIQLIDIYMYTMSMSYGRRVTFQRLDTPASPRLFRFFEYQKNVCPTADMSVLCC